MGQINYYRTRFFVEKERVSCLFSFFNLPLEKRKRLSSFDVGPSTFIKNKKEARKYVLLLKDSGIIFENVDKDTFIISFSPMVPNNYIKSNLFPVRIIWEHPQFPKDVLWWHNNSSLSFKQAYVISHFFTRKCLRCFRNGHLYFDNIPCNFTKVIDSVNRTKFNGAAFNDGAISRKFKYIPIATRNYKFEEIEKIGESIE